MKRAHVVRSIAIVAVLVMASMTAGCFQSKILMSIDPDELECQALQPFDNTITVTMAGSVAGGVYDTLTVQFFVDRGAGSEQLGEPIVCEGLKMVLYPVGGKVATLDVAELEDLRAPDGLWGGGAFIGLEAKFTLSARVSLGLKPVACTVRLVEKSTI